MPEPRPRRFGIPGSRHHRRDNDGIAVIDRAVEGHQDVLRVLMPGADDGFHRAVKSPHDRADFAYKMTLSVVYGPTPKLRGGSTGRGLVGIEGSFHKSNVLLGPSMPHVRFFGCSGVRSHGLDPRRRGVAADEVGGDPLELLGRVEGDEMTRAFDEVTLDQAFW